jgi:hypothetical protein
MRTARHVTEPQTLRRTISVSTDAAIAFQAAVDAQISDAAFFDEEWMRREGVSRVKGNQTRMQTGGCSQNRNQSGGIVKNQP